MATPRKQTSIKVDPVAWEEAKKIFKEYGLSASDAINVFLNKVRLERGFPFEIKLPTKTTLEAIKEVKNNQLEETSLEELTKEFEKCIIK